MSQLLDNHDLTTPRQLNTKALSYNRTITIPAPKEEDWERTSRNIGTAKGWVVEHQKFVRLPQILVYPLEIVEDVQSWFKDSFFTMRGSPSSLLSLPFPV